MQAVEPGGEASEVFFRNGWMFGNDIALQVRISRSMEQLRTGKAIQRRINEAPFISPDCLTIPVATLGKRTADSKPLRALPAAQTGHERVAVRPRDSRDAREIKGCRVQILRLGLVDKILHQQ